MFDPIEYKPHGTAASTTSTASLTVAPNKATSHISVSSVPLAGGPRTDLSQAVVEDTASSVEVNVEKDNGLCTAAAPGLSFSSIREPRAQFSSLAERVPVFKRNEELKTKQVFPPGTDVATRVKWASTALEMAGFDSIADFLDAVYTTEFPARNPCAELQKKAWEDGISQTLTVLSRHVAAADSSGKRPYDLTPYRKAVTRAAEAEYEREFAAIPKRKDRRQRDRATGKKVGRYDPSILHKKASDVDGDWLGTNVMMDTQREFMEKVSVLLRSLNSYSA
jgi:hypothetical protein